ncbi:zinc finger, CCHC-type containing protein [Tanacetum coccineum]
MVGNDDLLLYVLLEHDGLKQPVSWWGSTHILVFAAMAVKVAKFYAERMREYETSPDVAVKLLPDDVLVTLWGLVKQEEEQYRQQKANHVKHYVLQVDLDPYGSPSVFLDSTIQVLVTEMDPDELQSDLLALGRLYCLLMNDEGVLSMTSLEVNLASIL